MNLQKINKQLVTFCALALLFIGSLFYFISVAFKDTGFLQKKQHDNLKDYADILR
jgi:hypothetical protein